MQPSSIDLTLGGTLKRLPKRRGADPAIDQSDLWQEVPLRADGRWLLGQGTFYLGTTEETVSVPNNMLGCCTGSATRSALDC